MRATTKRTDVTGSAKRLTMTRARIGPLIQITRTNQLLAMIAENHAMKDEAEMTSENDVTSTESEENAIMIEIETDVILIAIETIDAIVIETTKVTGGTVNGVTGRADLALVLDHVTDGSFSATLSVFILTCK